MKGFVLAAGYGKRLRPLTRETPKPLVPVFGIPAICYSIMLLKEAGIDNIIINLHYKPRPILKFFLDHDYFGLNLSFAVEGRLMGTGGGVKRCREWLKNEPFILINSDILCDFKISPFVKKFKKIPTGTTLVLYSTPDYSKFGWVGTHRKRIVDFNNHFHSGKESNLIYTGIALNSPVLLKYLDASPSSVVNTGFFRLLEKRMLQFTVHEGLWTDIGSMESYREVHANPEKWMKALKSRMNRVMNLTMKAEKGRA